MSKLSRRGLMQALAGVTAAVPWLPKLMADAEAEAAWSNPPAEPTAVDPYTPNGMGGFRLYRRAFWRVRERERLFCFATGAGFKFDARRVAPLWRESEHVVMGPEPVLVHWDAKASALMQEHDVVFEVEAPAELNGILLVEPGGYPFAYASDSSSYWMTPGNTLTVQFAPTGIVVIS